MLPDIRPGNTKILYFFNCLLDGMHTKIKHICDFSRGVLNVRFCAHIQHLLRGHKYALFIFWSSVCWQPGKAKESIVGLLEELLSRTAKKFIVVEQS